MALMMFLVNLLASVYTQFSTMAIQQATSLNSYLKINQTLNYIENDVANMLTSGDGSTSGGTPDWPRNALYAAFMNTNTSNFTNGTPKLTFTTRDTNPSTIDSDGYQDVMYHTYNDSSTSDTALFRNSTIATDSPYHANNDLNGFVNSSNVILENVTYFGFYFSSNLLVWSSSDSTSPLASSVVTHNDYIYPDFINIILAVNNSHSTSEMRMTLNTPLTSIPILDPSIPAGPHINEDGEIQAGVSITKANYSISQFNGQSQGVAKVLTGSAAGKMLLYSTEYNTTDNTVNNTIKQLHFSVAPGGTSAVTVNSGEQIQLLQTFTRRCLVPR